MNLKGWIILWMILLSSFVEANSGRFEHIKHIVVVGVDGMSPDGINNAATPNIDKLIAKGAHTFAAQAVLPTSSSANWASMIMGATPQSHGIRSNAWQAKDVTESYCGNSPGEIWPTIFRVIREAKPEAVVACFHHWGGFGRLVEPDVCSKKKNVTGERKTAASVARYIKKNIPLFTFIHLDDVDQAGHRFGYGTEGYYKAVSKTDMHIGKIITALKESGMLESTVILVTSDHGGIGKGHGGNTPEERTIPWIISGPHVRKGMVIPQPINTYDTATTLAYILGLTPPECWIGKAITAAFIK